eukprot:s50_g37.t1
MNGANLSEARGALRKMAHLLQESPTRVCTFGTHKQVILPREPRSPRSSSTNALAVPDGTAPLYFSPKFDKLNPDIIGLQWKGRSPGTYMWHMILEDIREKYRPGKGKLRAIVITDGLDTHSPAPYQGIEGMNPMMQQLLEDGFDIEWHIVVVSINNLLGAISSADILKYEALAESTGGGFLHIDEAGVMNDYSARHFLTSLEKAVTGNDSSFMDSESFSDQQSKGARFLRRLHQSNHHLEDQAADEVRRQKQLEMRKKDPVAAKLPWLPLLESSRKGKK